jgi:hypothetical protein
MSNTSSDGGGRAGAEGVLALSSSKYALLYDIPELALLDPAGSKERFDIRGVASLAFMTDPSLESTRFARNDDFFNLNDPSSCPYIEYHET